MSPSEANGEQKMQMPQGFKKREGPKVNPNLGNGNQRKDSGGGSIWYNFPRPERNGERTETRIRLLPCWTKDPDDRYWMEVAEHFGQITDFDGSKRWKSVVCCETFGEPCPAHELRLSYFQRSKAAGESRSGDRDQSPLRRNGLDLLPRKRYLVQAILLDDIDRHGAELTPVVIRLNASVWRQIEDLERYKGSVADWEWGMPLKIVIHKTGLQKFNIEYKVFDEERAPLDRGLWPALDNLHDLKSMVKRSDDELDVLKLMHPRAFDEAAPAPKREKKAISADQAAPEGFKAKSKPSFEDDIPF